MAFGVQWFILCLALTVALASADGILLRRGSTTPRFARTMLLGMLNMLLLLAMMAYVDHIPFAQAAGAVLALGVVVAAYWLVVRPRLI
jgi:hypothetical protein